MRIVLSNASFKWGGVHLITDLLAGGLTARGHDVQIHCHRDSDLHVRLRDRFDCVAIAQGMDFSPLAIARSAAALKRFRANAMLTFMEKDLRIGGIAAHMLGIPVLARRANDRAFRSGIRRRFTYRTIATKHIANSRATRATILQSAPWLASDRVDVIYNGIDVERIATATPIELPVPQGDDVVGFTGRLEERKGVRELLDAWEIVARTHPRAHLVIGGRGPLEREIARRAGSLPRAHYIGYRTDVPNVLNALSLLVVPSYWEGFGLVAAEGLAAGRPVIASNASSLPEIVRDGVDGLLVPPRDATALAAAIGILLDDPDLRRRMGANGHERAGVAFSHDRMIDDYERALAELTRSRS